VPPLDDPCRPRRSTGAIKTGSADRAHSLHPRRAHPSKCHVEPQLLGLGVGMQAPNPLCSLKKSETTDIFIHFIPFYWCVCRITELVLQVARAHHHKLKALRTRSALLQREPPPKVTPLVFVNSTVTTELSFKVCLFPGLLCTKDHLKRKRGRQKDTIALYMLKRSNANLCSENV
jgi:hypothetical protein